MGFVYRDNSGTYEVGYFDGAGVFVVESSQGTGTTGKDKAVKRTHYLNGGSRT